MAGPCNVLKIWLAKKNKNHRFSNIKLRMPGWPIVGAGGGDGVGGKQILLVDSNKI
jgi:hypothetical protein